MTRKGASIGKYIKSHIQRLFNIVRLFYKIQFQFGKLDFPKCAHTFPGPSQLGTRANAKADPASPSSSSSQHELNRQQLRDGGFRAP